MPWISDEEWKEFIEFKRWKKDLIKYVSIDNDNIVDDKPCQECGGPWPQETLLWGP